jgi:drug/metabolite transporter (DMT)-like permease
VADLVHRRGMILVAAAALAWSAGGLLARLIGTDTWTTVFWRGIFCALFLLAWIALREGRQTWALFARMGWAGLAVAACFATASTSFVLALARTSVANTLIIQCLAPFIASALGWLWLGEHVRARTWTAMAAALGGSLIMVSGSPARGTLAGDMLALLMATAFSVAAVTVRRHQGIRMTPAVCVAAVLFALFALPQARPGSAGPGDLALLLLFGAGQLGLGLALFTTGARLIPVAEATLIAVLESILGPLWVWLALGEHPGARSLLGGAVILAALAGHTAFDLGRPAPAPEAAPARSARAER